ncbi:hypothetical protein [Dysgonomonas sp. 520]|uniref:hypothetical protein n=1 Tax=Dysgonomonas sp. 520 TaxID=2302931 RepID=UPI0013CFC2DA|nr:hypothetical protein [Dysgonomonas sp. 520]NDW08803.1 hypothetical protein [Dysgonomonas sp. 520]
MVKNIIITGFILGGFSLLGNAQSIGINTQNPTNTLHIDAAKDNSATPTGTQLQNDVVVDNEGRLGIGTTTPNGKVSIVSNVPGAIQLIDGQQQQGLILTSDADGNARWSLPIPSTGKIEAIIELGPQEIATVAGLYVPVPTSTYTVKADGYHVVEIRWYATYSAAYTRDQMTSTHIRLLKNNELVDEYEAYQDITPNITDAVTFFTSLATYAKAGDVLNLVVRPGFAPGNMILAKSENLRTSKMIIKRLTMR